MKGKPNTEKSGRYNCKIKGKLWGMIVVGPDFVILVNNVPEFARTLFLSFGMLKIPSLSRDSWPLASDF